MEEEGYILYCSEFGFESCSLLIPVRYESKLDVLRKHVSNGYIRSRFIKNLIISNIIYTCNWNYKTSSTTIREMTEYSELVENLIYQSPNDNTDETCWLKDCIYHVCDDKPNIIDGYIELMEKGKYQNKKIVEGFIVLEKWYMN
jgi:hypothetical protein